MDEIFDREYSSMGASAEANLNQLTVEVQPVEGATKFFDVLFFGTFWLLLGECAESIESNDRLDGSLRQL